MINIISIIVGLIFVYIVYLGLCRQGFLLGYILNLLYCFVNYYSRNSNITIITVAKILLIVAIITGLEYVANQKSQSFVGYFAYVVLMVIGIIVVVFLTKALFSFMANPFEIMNG